MISSIQTILQKIEIYCKRCDFKGEIVATRKYYIDCPECGNLVYVKNLTQDK